MSNIILPGGSAEEEQGAEAEGQQLQYKATEEDEERFFLMYHMNFQPSEVETIDPQYRKWLIVRFIGQKKAEQDAVERMRLMSELGPNLRG